MTDPRRSGKRAELLSSALIAGLLVGGMVGCGSDDSCVCCPPDTQPPAAPRGLYSTTGDGEVRLNWLANTEPDLASYRVWWSRDYEGEYQLIALVQPSGEYYEEFVDGGAVNGETYFYAVTAIDAVGNESGLSQEWVEDTPRPDGEAALPSRHLAPEVAGFDFCDGNRYARLVPFDDLDADFYYQYVPETGEKYIVTAHPDLVWMQDMGHAVEFHEINMSPGAGQGWSPTGIVEAIAGHIYVFRILDDPAGFHAKIWLSGADQAEIRFQWAYQTQPGNLQLSVP